MTPELDTTAMNAPEIVDASLPVHDVDNTKLSTSASLSLSPMITTLEEDLLSYIAKENQQTERRSVEQNQLYRLRYLDLYV